MLTVDTINNAYFNWMYDLVCGNRFANDISYRKLLMQLHNIEFVYSIPRDSDRADDGIELRYRFPHEFVEVEDIGRYIVGPCSVLEMMIALAIRCEETIMDNPKYGDRTSQWFWEMLVSLGLGSMEDSRFDKKYVNDVMRTFLNRKYEANGKGGLFTIRNCEYDLRRFSIWHQLCWYLDRIS